MKRRIRPHGPLFLNGLVRDGWLNVYISPILNGRTAYYISTMHGSREEADEWLSATIKNLGHLPKEKRLGMGPIYRIRVKVKPEYVKWLEEDRRKTKERQAVIDQYELEKAALRRERRERRKQISAIDAIADAMMPTLPKAGG